MSCDIRSDHDIINEHGMTGADIRDYFDLGSANCSKLGQKSRGCRFVHITSEITIGRQKAFREFRVATRLDTGNAVPN